MKKKRTSVTWMCLIAFGMVMNIVGAFLAMNLRLPIYLDSIGTAVTAAFLGPVAGAITGFFGSICSGFLFDVYSFYYAPAQILTGLMGGWLFSSGWLFRKGQEGRKHFRHGRLLAGTLAVSVPTSIASSIVTAFLFGGITSSGSTYIVVLLDKLGVPLTASCFIVQALTDYGDELAALAIASAVLSVAGSQIPAMVRRS
ncbi:MAG TPA: ECF transporter S component [Candidatus Scybalocola faecigallinarum]|uniref:ECF transporter S component n=1 Tax=Candidatus Scybalocola faecigallinarum TaxID=2840941 RepID=A0A9D1F693_9FIRM|nr:ECF transporter S component [Candidatus Scybalocola faecigallinarum]